MVQNHPASSAVKWCSCLLVLCRDDGDLMWSGTRRLPT